MKTSYEFLWPPFESWASLEATSDQTLRIFLGQQRWFQCQSNFCQSKKISLKVNGHWVGETPRILNWDSAWFRWIPRISVYATVFTNVDSTSVSSWAGLANFRGVECKPLILFSQWWPLQSREDIENISQQNTDVWQEEVSFQSRHQSTQSSRPFWSWPVMATDNSLFQAPEKTIHHVHHDRWGSTGNSSVLKT